MPQIRVLCRLLTYVWGSMMIVSGVLQVFIALTLLIHLAVVINQVLNALILGGISVFTVAYLRRKSFL